MAENDVTITVKSVDRSDPQGVRRKWRASQQAMVADSRKSGEDAGREFGEGFTRDASGRLRDANGRFVNEGDRAGKSWASGFGGSISGGSLAGKILGSFTSVFKLSAKTAATAFSAQFIGSVAAGLASGAAKVAHGAAAMAALLPAAAVAGVTAMASLKLAVVGVGDAMSAAVTGDAKEFNEAIKGLSPSARGFAREVRGMRVELKGLQQGVQQSFFAQFAGDTKRLGATYLPMVRSALTGVAASFGQAVHSSAQFLQMPEVSGQLAMALGHVKNAVGNVAGALPDLIRGFLPLVTVGSTFLPKLTEGLGGAARGFADFMEQARDSGKLADFIQGGLDKVKDLWDTFQQLWRIGGNVVAIFREFGSAGGGVLASLGIQSGGLLDTLEAMTEKAEAFFKTASGGAAITEIFGILRSLLNATFGTLAHLVPIIGRAFAPILPQLSKFAEAVVNLQLALADALAPALGAIADILGVILPPMTAVLDAISGNETASAALAGALITLYGAWKLVSAASAIAKSSISGAAIGMGTVAAAAGAMVMALIQIDAANHAKQLESMTEALIAQDGAVSQATRGWIYAAQIMGGLDELMSNLIDTNPRVAQTILDNADAYGITAEEAAKYQDELDTATAAIDNQVSALERQKNALTSMTDPVFAAMDAQQQLADAQQRLTDLMTSGTATAEEITRAHQDVVEAATGNTAAQYDLGAAIEAGGTSLKGYLKELKRQRDAGVITEASYRSQAFTATAMFGQVKRSVEAVPGSKTTKLHAKDFASAAIEGVRRMLARLRDKHITVSVGMAVGAGVGAALANFAHGGITGAAAGGPRSRMTWVGEHGPELVKLPPGSHVSSNADSMRMASQSGGGGTLRVYHDDGGDPVIRHLMKGLRYEIAADGGNVQAVLGQR